MNPLGSSESDLATTGDLASPAHQWLDEHGDALFRYARLRVRDRELAEDLVQETFLAAIQSMDRFRQQASRQTWLIAILRRKIVDHHRRRATREAGHAEPVVSPEAVRGRYFDEEGFWKAAVSPWKSADAAIEHQEFWSVFNTCLGDLPPSFARAFLLRTIEGLESSEVCEQLGVNAGNLRVRLHRARLLLRECLETRWFHSSRDPEPRMR